MSVEVNQEGKIVWDLKQILEVVVPDHDEDLVNPSLDSLRPVGYKEQ
jgi:hypothetical protein